MGLFDYLYACSFWQWVGNIAIVVPLAWGIRRWLSFQINWGMNSGSTTYYDSERSN